MSSNSAKALACKGENFLIYTPGALRLWESAEKHELQDWRTTYLTSSYLLTSNRKGLSSAVLLAAIF